jgi:exonuclease SbcD
LKYSNSEADDVKSCVVVDLKSKNEIAIETVDLVPLHNVRDIHGLLQEIIDMPYSEDYVRIELNDEEVPPDARILLSSTVFPNMIRFAVNNSKTSSETEIDISDNIENKSILELFKDFYSLQNNGVEPDDARIKIINDIVESIGDSDHEAM